MPCHIINYYRLLAPMSTLFMNPKFFAIFGKTMRKSKQNRINFSLFRILYMVKLNRKTIKTEILYASDNWFLQGNFRDFADSKINNNRVFICLQIFRKIPRVFG